MNETEIETKFSSTFYYNGCSLVGFQLSKITLGMDHLIFGGGGPGSRILLNKIVCFPTGAKKMKCLNEVKNKKFFIQ